MRRAGAVLLAALLLPVYWVAPGLALGFRLGRGRPRSSRWWGSLPLGFALPALLVPWSRWLGFPYKETWVVLSAAGLLFLAWEWSRPPAAGRENGTNERGAWAIVAVSVAVFVVGYLVPLRSYIAMPGMDMAMHSTFARLISEHGAIPRTQDPIYPGAPFGVYPLGFHATVALAATWLGDVLRGGKLVVALVHAFVPVALYVATKRPGVDRPTLLAALAVAWISRDPQAQLAWGGNPSVLGTCVAFVALRWSIDALRSRTRSDLVRAGVMLAATALIHPTSALTSAYLVPFLLLGLTAIGEFRWTAAVVRRALVLTVLAGLLAGPQIPVTLSAGLSDAEARWERESHAEFDPLAQGVGSYLGARYGDAMVGLALLALAANLVALRRPRIEGLLVAGLVGLVGFTVLAVRVDLPGGFALRPDRIPLFGLPLLVLLVARLFGTLARGWPGPGIPRVATVAAALVAVAVTTTAVLRHHRYYVSGPRRMELVFPEDRRALAWLDAHVPRGTAIDANYSDAGVYIPAVLGRPVTRPQVNPVSFEEIAASLQRLEIGARYRGARSVRESRAIEFIDPHDVLHEVEGVHGRAVVARPRPESPHRPPIPRRLSD